MNEQLREVRTVKEMREEIERMSLYDPLIHQVFTLSQYELASETTKYILLAYYALRVRQNSRDQLVNSIGSF